jgi:hypothetical protein
MRRHEHAEIRTFATRAVIRFDEKSTLWMLLKLANLPDGIEVIRFLVKFLPKGKGRQG